MFFYHKTCTSMKKRTLFSLTLSLIMLSLAPALTYFDAQAPTVMVPDNADNDVYLTVTPYEQPGHPGLLKMPSCVHSKSHLQFTNTHKTDTLTITSIDTIPTDGPLQMHVSKFQKRTVIIKPLASVLLPITFAPKIYSQTTSLDQTSLERKTRTKRKWLSRAAAADLADLIESDGFNLKHPGDLHLVQTVLDIRTSRGKKVTLIKGSALKANQYRIPHDIIFYNDGFVASGEILAEQQRLNYLESKKRGSPYTYDLHIRNPSNQAPLIFSEIYTTRPDLIQLSYQHSGKNRFSNCGTPSSKGEDCHLPHSYDIGGPPVIPIGSNMTYLTTISVKPAVHGMMTNETGTMLLADLHMISSNETLSIALRYSNSELDNYYSESNYTNRHMSGGVEKFSKVPIISQRNGKKLLGCDPMNNETVPVMVDVGPSHRKEERQSRFVGGINLLSSPSYLDFGLFTMYGETRKVGISIINNGDQSVRLMRQKVSLEVSSVREDGDMDKEVILLPMGGKDGDDFLIKANVDVRDKSHVIQQGERANDIAFLSLTSIAKPQRNETYPIEVSGSVLLYFGDSSMSFSEWKDVVTSDPFGSQKDMVEIFFTVRIMYGRLQYDLRSVHFPTLAASFHTNKDNEETNSLCTKGFHRTIHFTHNFPTSLQLNTLSIESENSTHTTTHTGHNGNACKELFQISDFEGSERNRIHSPLATAESGESWGAVTLQYNYMPHSSGVIPLDKCFLVLNTDVAGSFFVPLHIFSASTEVDSDQIVTPEKCQNADLSTQTFDLDCFYKALHIDGNVSLPLMKDKKKRNGQDLKTTLTNKYLQTLKKTLPEVNGKETTLKPILLSLGSLSFNSVEKFSISVKNYNPIPITITAFTSAIEGMEIRLAKSSLSLADFVGQFDAYIHTNEYRTNQWMQQILMKSQSSQDFLGSFSMCDHIYPLHDVSNGMKRLYKQYARLRFYPDRGLSTRNKTDAFHDEVKLHPPSFKQMDANTTVTADGHFLIIGNKTFALHKEETSESTNWTIPPGGVAKFELLVKSPSLDLLSDSDISEVLTTGVVLYSNAGEVIPIFTSYQVLSGSFKIVPSSTSTNNVTGTNHVKTRPIFRSRHNSKQLSTKNENDLNEQSFLVENGFSTDVLLKKFNSCNRWMEIEIHHNVSRKSSESFKPLLIHSGETVRASVHSTIHCAPKDIGQGHPSFFHCVLEWLKHKQLFTSDDCIKTSSEDEYKVTLTNPTSNEPSEIDKSLKKVIQAFSRAVTYLNEKYNNRKRNDVSSYKHLPHEVSDIFNQAFNHWKILCKLGQNIVSGSVQAQFELMTDSQFNLTSVELPQTITTILEKFSFSTSLEVPRLFDVHSKVLGNSSTAQENNIIDFGITPISEISKAFIPVINPTGHTIRVRLVVCAECSTHGDSGVFVHSKSRLKHPWWTGGSYFLSDEKGELLISNHNVTIETASGSSLSLMNPSLHSSSAFTRGCTGRRCGGSFADGNNGQHEHLQKISPIGGASSINEVLTGRIYDTNGKTERTQSRGFSPHQYPSFALSSKSIKEATIAPFGSTLLGPLYFRPTSRSHFKASTWLENSVTGLERIQLKGTGGLEKIIFLETNDLGATGGAIETRFNKPTLVFHRMKNEPYGSLIRNVLVANVGDVEVKFNGVWLSEAQAKGYLNFSAEENDSKCKRRGFQIIDCRELEDKADIGSFSLKPKEAKQLRLMYKPDCTFKSLFVSLVLDFSVDDLEQGKSLELLLGYQMNENDIGMCNKNLIYHNQGRYHRKNIAQASSLFLPLVILGLIMIDILYTVHRRQFTSKDFRKKATMTSSKTGFKNWVAAFRCLSRGEHDSTDLTNLGKEQTRQILLARFRKDGMLLPQCILQTGALNRERHLFGNNTTENTTSGNGNATSDAQSSSTPTSRRTATAVAKTLSESIFALVHSLESSGIYEYNGIKIVVPQGLDWKKAVRSGIVQWTGRSNKRQNKIDFTKALSHNSKNKKASPDDTVQKDYYNQAHVNRKESKVKILAALHESNNVPLNEAQKSKSIPSSNAPSVTKVRTEEIKSSDKTSFGLKAASRRKDKLVQSTQPKVVKAGDIIKQKTPIPASSPTEYLDRADMIKSYKPPNTVETSNTDESVGTGPQVSEKVERVKKKKKIATKPLISPHEKINQNTPFDSTNSSIPSATNSYLTQEPKQSSPEIPKYSPIGPRRETKSCTKDHDNGKSVISEDDSMSVSDSVSTTSTRKFEQIEISEKQGKYDFNKPPLRLPPGLAPPPGFTKSDKLHGTAQDKEFTTPTQSNSSSLLAYNPILSNLLNDHEDAESPDYGIVTLKEDQHGDDDDDKVLLGLGEDFDVMNFFSFLDDGVQQHSQKTSSAAEDENNNSIIYESKNRTVQANPWGGNTQTPRALAYGIEVETGNNREVDRDQNNIQLLTPSMILGQDLENEDDKNEMDREDLIFNFSRLLED